MLPKVAIIYLSYNGKKYLKEVFSALDNLDYPKDRLEIIVVDNDSKDGSQEVLRKMDGITFFPSGKNLGFAGGNNLGTEHALLEGADYIYLHNNDLKLEPQAIKEAVALAESDKEIGSVQSVMKLWRQENVLNSTGGMVHFLGFGFVRDNGAKVSDVDRKDGEEIAYASGAAVLYRATVLKQVGLLDPFLFLYHEDLELGWRIRLAGFKNVLSMKSIAFHDYEFKRSITKFYWMERNRILVHFSHLKCGTILVLLPFLFVMEIALLFFAIKGGWIKEKLFVYFQFLKPSTWVYVFKSRKRSKIIRKVSDEKIVSIFTGKIDHQETSSKVVEEIGNPVLQIIWSILKQFIVW